MITLIATHPEYPHDFSVDLQDMDAVNDYLALLAEYLSNIGKCSDKITWRIEQH